MTSSIQSRVCTLSLATLCVLVGCGGGVDSAANAQRAYQGLDASIDKAITLGLDGFNAASSANIPDQVGDGAATGTMTIAGQVDQGTSTNKTMNLTDALADYSDDNKLTYDTTTPAALDMKLSKIPAGTIDGTLNGTFKLSGELAGSVTLTLTFSGVLEPVASDPTKIERKPGTTHITGTADSNYGTYTVDITR